VSKNYCDFVERLLYWFSTNGRTFPWRQDVDPYKVLVAEKLLQQTTYGHVLKVYDTFFKRFPDLRSLAEADVSEIEAVIRRLGFHRQRAKQLKEAAQIIINEFEGKVPGSREDLLKLSGVGEYVASAVLCFAFGNDVPVVDMNVRRVVGRVFGWKGVDDKKIASRLSKIIPAGKAKQFNWALIDFSAIICSRKPKCRVCFLKDICKEYGLGT